MLGASVVGMSMQPEMAVASTHLKTKSMRGVGLGFITNDALKKHDPEEIIARAKAAGPKLGQYLVNLIFAIQPQA